MAEEKDLFKYDEDSIKSLDWREHIRLRPGMYIGKLGDGSAPDDGIYVMIKEVLDNCVDEHMMGYGKHIDITIEARTVTVRDYGRGIPLGKVVDVVSKINTGAKYDSKAFQKSVGLNGVGIKAVNALSNNFKVESFREGRTKVADFEKGILIKEYKEIGNKILHALSAFAHILRAEFCLCLTLKYRFLHSYRNGCNNALTYVCSFIIFLIKITDRFYKCFTKCLLMRATLRSILTVYK